MCMYIYGGVAGKVESRTDQLDDSCHDVVELAECPRDIQRERGACHERTEAFQAVEAKRVIRPAK